MKPTTPIVITTENRYCSLAQSGHPLCYTRCRRHGHGRDCSCWNPIRTPPFISPEMRVDGPLRPANPRPRLPPAARALVLHLLMGRPSVPCSGLTFHGHAVHTPVPIGPFLLFPPPVPLFPVPLPIYSPTCSFAMAQASKPKAVPITYSLKEYQVARVTGHVDNVSMCISSASQRTC